MSTWRADGLREMRKIAGVLLISLLLPIPLYANDLTERLSVRGFGTLDITHSDSNGALLPTSSANPAPLNKGKTSYDSSVLGLQADYSLTNNLDFTLQATSTAQRNGSSTPTVDWAYLNYDLGNDLKVRAGKMKLSFVQGTELRYVGFSRLWVRPLVPTSGAGGFDDYVGANLIKGAALGSYNMSFEATYGKAHHEQNFVHDHDVRLISSRIEKNESWIRFALLQANYKVDNKDGVTLKNNAKLLMGSVEAEVLLGDTVFNGGYTRGRADINPNEQLGYLSLGHRIDRFTPYLLLSQRRMTVDASERPAALPTRQQGSPPPPPPLLLRGSDKTNTVALGFRYNLGASYALKGQLDRWTTHKTSNPLTGAVSSRGNLFTLALDVVF